MTWRRRFKGVFKGVWIGLNSYVENRPVPSGLVKRHVMIRLARGTTFGGPRYRRFLFFPTPNLPLPWVRPGTMVDAKLERHDSRHPHLDFRVKINGRVYDFALAQKLKFPKPGPYRTVIHTPHHSDGYFELDKAEFKPGEYGAGKMRTVWRGRIIVHACKPGKIEFTMPDEVPDYVTRGRYVIWKDSDGWHMNALKRVDAMKLWRERMPFKNTTKAVADAHAGDSYLAEQKRDGAHFELFFADPKDQKGNLLLSRRLSVKDGRPIDRIDKIPELRDMKPPDESWYWRCVHVELVSVGPDGEDRPSTLAGLLNAMTDLSLKNQERLGPIQSVAIDLEGSGIYLDRKEEMRKLANSSPRIDRRLCGSIRDRFLFVRLRNPRIMTVAIDNRDLGMSTQDYSDYIKATGGEGVVLKYKHGTYYGPDQHIKDKAFVPLELTVVGFNEGVTGETVGSLGSLMCVDPETGAKIDVGTGFSRWERWWIWTHQDLVMGSTIIAAANRPTEESYHGPRFKGWHPDSLVVMDEQGLFDYAEAISRDELEMIRKKHALIHRKRS
jgi:hypothetical protein